MFHTSSIGNKCTAFIVVNGGAVTESANESSSTYTFFLILRKRDGFHAVINIPKLQWSVLCHIEAKWVIRYHRTYDMHRTYQRYCFD